MLLSYKFNNYRSFNDTSEFDMIASSTKVRNRFPNNFVKHPTGVNPLKTSIIVGENAGGKSNFIESINFLKSLFRVNQTVKSSKTLMNINTPDVEFTAQGDYNRSQVFDLEVVILNKIYSYHLKIDLLGIAEEKLLVRNSKKSTPIIIFNIWRNNVVSNNEKIGVTFDIEYTLKTALQRQFTQNNAFKRDGIGLYISKMALVDNEDALLFCRWVNEDLYAEKILTNYDFQKSIIREEDDLKILKDKKYVEILKMVDYSIEDVQVSEENPYTETIIIRKKEDGSKFRREIREDSTGVREFFAWAVQIFRVVYENKVIFADEMDRVLNPILSDRVMGFINGSDHTGQFIITSHNALHLDLRNMMKEQIYFITKDANTLNSEIYSLADFPEVRYETTKIYEFYMKGVLGGTSYE